MTNNLGATCDEIWPRARAGDQSRFTRTDRWVPGVDLLVGAVTTSLPDIPAHRHSEISAQVRDICDRYGVPYNTGPLPRQFATVVRKIFKLALPGKQPSRQDAISVMDGEDASADNAGTRR